jgi:hypothetical protein
MPEGDCEVLSAAGPLDDAAFAQWWAATAAWHASREAGPAAVAADPAAVAADPAAAAVAADPAAAVGAADPAALLAAMLAQDEAVAARLCGHPALAVDLAAPRPLGLPLKPGVQVVPAAAWAAIRAFVQSDAWRHAAAVCPADAADPLTAAALPYGAFMLGFDFHLTPAGPRLIEINTNAGGLATVLGQAGSPRDQSRLRVNFAKAVCLEYFAATGRPRPRRLAIVDTAVETQGLVREMRHFAALLGLFGVPTVVVSPEDLRPAADGALTVGPDAQPVDMMYGRTYLRVPGEDGSGAEGLRLAFVLGGPPALSGDYCGVAATCASSISGCWTRPMRICGRPRWPGVLSSRRTRPPTRASPTSATCCARRTRSCPRGTCWPPGPPTRGARTRPSGSSSPSAATPRTASTAATRCVRARGCARVCVRE